MKHLYLTMITVCALACDAAVVAQTQEGDPAQSAAVAVQAVEATIKPDDLDLESINFVVKKGKVKNAAELEKLINNPKEELSNVDIDGDGKVDKIQVVEVQKENDVKVFELHVIPSKSKNKGEEVLIATVTFTPDIVSKQLVVKSVYAPIVIGHATIVYDYTVPIEVEGGKIVVVQSNPFYGWLFTVSRPAFVGVFVYSEPAPPVIIIEKRRRHRHWHHGGKGKGWKGKGWKGKG
jgi:uncharacterized cupredoxin-like copper-binding protein